MLNITKIINTEAMKTARQILATYRNNDNYTIEEAEKELLDLFSVSRSFSDWIKEVARLDKEQEFLLESEEIFEWHEWYQKGMTPEDALNCNYHNYG